MAGSGLVALGCVVTCLNFYLSFLRYPLHRLRGKSQRDYHWISGIPIFGTLALWIGSLFLLDFVAVVWFALIVSLLDTGGLHWFCGTAAWYSLKGAAAKIHS